MEQVEGEEQVEEVEEQGEEQVEESNHLLPSPIAYMLWWKIARQGLWKSWVKRPRSLNNGIVGL